MIDETWHPIETAPRNNTPFDVMAVDPAGNMVIIPDCRCVRNMLNKWEVRGNQNKISPYLTMTGWRATTKPADTNP